MGRLIRLTFLALVLLPSLMLCMPRFPTTGGNYCQKGGQVTVTSGLNSSTKQQQTYPSATVTVYIAGGASGSVSTSGETVTWVSGNTFNANSQWNGLPIVINGVTYTISSVSSTTSLTLTSSAGTQAGPVTYSVANAPAAVFSDDAGTAKANPFTCDSTGYYFFYADNGTYDVTFSGTGISAPFTNSSMSGTDPIGLPTPNVRYYGAKGDGNTDDTSAIQAAYAVAASNNGVLSFPCGTYIYSSTISIASRIVIQGSGPGDSGPGNPCTRLVMTAAEPGITIESGADYAQIRGISLSSTASTGTSDGIVVGGADNTNGAGNVTIEDVTVSSFKGNGINVLNGNDGIINRVTVNNNGVNGLLISSQQLSAENTNAWTVQNVTALANTQDGINNNLAAATRYLNFDSEGNGRYGWYGNRPNLTVYGYAENNTTDDVYEDSGMYSSVGAIRNTDNTWGGAGIAQNALCNQGGVIICPAIVPTTMRQVPTAAIGSLVVAPTYGSTVTINNDLGNAFYITATNGTAFTISAPSNANFSQRITITIKNGNASTALGTITWSAYVLNSNWISPAPGCSRSIDFELSQSTSTWTEVSRTYADVCSGSSHADFEFSNTAPVIQTGLTSTSSTTAFSYPNIPVAATWRTTCNALTTSVGSAGTVVLTLLYAGSTYGEVGPVTLDLTSTSNKKISVSDWETIAANTSGASVGIRWTVTGNSGGVFTVSCLTERAQ